MPGNVVPQLLNSCTIYNSKSREMYGIANVTTPPIEWMTSTVKGFGIAGEATTVSVGNPGALPLTLSFTTVSGDLFELAEPRAHALDIWCAIQDYDASEGNYDFRGYRIAVVAVPTKTDPGKLEPSSPMDGTVEMECSYIKIIYDNRVVLEFDRYNHVCTINGVNYAKPIQALLGR